MTNELGDLPEYTPTLTPEQRRGFDMLLTTALKMADMAVAGNEQLPPLLLAVPEDRSQVMVAMLPGQDKQLWLPLARRFLEADGIAAVALVDEAWMMETPSLEALAADPSLAAFEDGTRSLAEAPEAYRWEVVMVTVLDRMEQGFTACRIDRANRTVQRQPLQFMDPKDPALVGRFTRMDGVTRQ